VIQAVMGWTDSHLHEFRIAGQHYGFPDVNDELMPYRVISETWVRLDAALQEIKTFGYLYDFGDSWEHRLHVEKTLPPTPLRHPVCLGGECACPPDDVGGLPGYANFVRIILDPTDPEHEEMLQWCGGAFDPAFFDIDLANRLLERIKL
jgi:Plasmid pRiA4b ORF-3-like protein